MPWTYLNDATLATKPNVLAGPILRKVTPGSVTVWFALKRRATVKLTVVDANGGFLFDGTRETVAAGPHLHFVAVTAATTAFNQAHLEPNHVYMYKAEFTYDAPSFDDSIAKATNNAPLTYGSYPFPSFSLPPANIHDLRLLHGSCRRPDGNGLDVLAIVDPLIEQKATLPLERPHQLLLTGDQIYADDVTPAMLFMLSDVATHLMGEEFVTIATNKSVKASSLVSFRRRPILEKAKFSSVDLSSHLLSLGEFLCMYLLTWSDVLWPALDHMDQMPDASQVRDWCYPYFFTNREFLKATRPRKPADVRDAEKKSESIRSGIDAGIKRLVVHRATLPNVRRALANVPTYMIFDDHEVTDDWNMTEDLAADLYSTRLGREVTRNALIAYALCQHWGNAPEQFSRFDPTLPGTKLLGMLPQRDSKFEEVCSILTVPTAAEIRGHHRVPHAASSLTYNYVIEGDAHQILVTDTRTWRAFVGEPDLAPDLLPPAQFAAQIANAGKPLDGRQLIVVLSTNAPPTLGIREASKQIKRSIANTFEHFPDIHEAWDIPTVAFDRLMTALSEKVGFSAGQSKRVVLLSGDVHHGFATRLHYKAINRFEQTTAGHANIVVAQAVASGYHRQDHKTLGLQREGFDYAPHITKPLVPDAETEYYLGWNLQPAGQPVAIWNGLHCTLRDASSLRFPPPKVLPDELGHIIITPPDFSYQLDYLKINGGGVPKVPVPLPVVPPGQTPGELSEEEKRARAHLLKLATDNYRTHNREIGVAREIIGVNNMGELTFPIPPAPATGPFKANHRLWFRTPDGLQAFVDISINMESNDPDHPLPAGFPEVQP